MEDNKLGTEVVLTAEEAVSLADLLSNHITDFATRRKLNSLECWERGGQT